MEEVKRMSDTLKRYVVDERTGCAAIRDTKNEEYQHEGPGLYSSFSSVVEFVSYYNDYNGDATDIQKAESALKIKYLNDLCEILNGELPKPKTRTEYVKVEFNEDYDALKAFHNGDKFFVKSKDGNYYPVKHPHRLVKAFHDDRLYCVIEKEIDWRDEVTSFLENANLPNKDADWSVGDWYVTDYDFLDMCRTALRATGELE